MHLYRPGAFVWLLLAATLFMRAVMPQGYMAKQAGGEIIVDICNSDATWRIPLPPKDGEAQDHDKAAPCAFAGHASPAVPVADAPEPVVLALPVETQPVRSAQGLTRAAPRLLPPATGPPITV